MQAIQVKFIPATDRKPARMKAWIAEKGSATVICNPSKADNINAREAAMELLKKLGFKGAWMGAQLPIQDFAFMCVHPDSDLIVGV